MMGPGFELDGAATGQIAFYVGIAQLVFQIDAQTLPDVEVNSQVSLDGRTSQLIIVGAVAINDDLYMRVRNTGTKADIGLKPTQKCVVTLTFRKPAVKPVTLKMP